MTSRRILCTPDWAAREPTPPSCHDACGLLQCHQFSAYVPNTLRGSRPGQNRQAYAPTFPTHIRHTSRRPGQNILVHNLTVNITWYARRGSCRENVQNARLVIVMAMHGVCGGYTKRLAPQIEPGRKTLSSHPADHQTPGTRRREVMRESHERVIR